MLTIARLVKMRSKQRPQVYLMMHGFTRDEARSLLNPQLSAVKLSTQLRLCNLFSCYPNDLFGYQGSTSSHLNGLNHDDPTGIDDMLEGLSPDEIAELKRLADEQRRKKGK